MRGDGDQEARPNILLIINDDLGHGNLGCEGSPDVSTPHIDALAADGVRLSAYYTASPVCTPARAALLTGRHPERSDSNRVFRQEDDHTGMARAEITLADLLAGEGYRTGLVGKWHLGMAPDRWPTRRGFHEFYGILNGMIDYYTHVSLGGGGRGEKHFYRNDERIDPQGYFTDLVTEEACDFIGRNVGRPFFLTVAYTAPHPPMQAPEAYLRRFAHIENEGRRAFAAMVACMDDGIGRILRRLRDEGIEEQTVVVFVSDHGWDYRRVHEAVNGPLRLGKYWLYEGGIRVPCLIRWPGRLPAGWVCPVPVIAMDLFTTLLTWAGGRLPQDRVVDGRDLTSVLRREKDNVHEALCWLYHRDDLAGVPEQAAIRRGRWKLLRVDGRVELYDLEADVGEEHDLAASQPARCAEMEAVLERWLEEVRQPAIRSAAA